MNLVQQLKEMRRMLAASQKAALETDQSNFERIRSALESLGPIPGLSIGPTHVWIEHPSIPGEGIAIGPSGIGDPNAEAGAGAPAAVRALRALFQLVEPSNELAQLAEILEGASPDGY